MEYDRTVCIIVCAGIIAIGISGFVAATYIIPNQINQPTFFKIVTVDEKYERVDAYMNHYPPYFTTTDGEIYDIGNDFVWARLKYGMIINISYTSPSPSGNQRTGWVNSISLVK